MTCAISSWSRISDQADKIAIIASGPSSYGVNFGHLAPDVHIIAIKGAIDGLLRVDKWVTVDANNRVRERWMKTPRFGVDYIAAVPEDYGHPQARVLWHRDPPERHFRFLHRISGEGRYGFPGLSEDASAVHSGNSAYGGLGIAYHMRPRKIAIFGLDATQDQYGIGGAGRPRGLLTHLPQLFASAVPQLLSRGISVVLGSPDSRVRSFERMNPNVAIRWLNGG